MVHLPEQAPIVQEEKINITARFAASGEILTTACLVLTDPVRELRCAIEASAATKALRQCRGGQAICLLLGDRVLTEADTFLEAGLADHAEIGVTFVDPVGAMRSAPCFMECKQTCNGALPPEFYQPLLHPEVQSCIQDLCHAVSAVEVHFALGARAMIMFVGPDMAAGSLVVAIPVHLPVFSHPGVLLELLCYWSLFFTNPGEAKLEDAQCIAKKALGGGSLPDWRSETTWSCAFLGTFPGIVNYPCWAPLNSDLQARQEDMVVFCEESLPLVEVLLPEAGTEEDGTFSADRRPEEQLQAYKAFLTMPAVQNMLLALLAMLPHSDSWVGLVRELKIITSEQSALMLIPPSAIRESFQVPAGVRIANEHALYVAVPLQDEEHSTPRNLLQALWYLSAMRLGLPPDSPLLLDDHTTLRSDAPALAESSVSLSFIGNKLNWFEASACHPPNREVEDAAEYWSSMAEQIANGSSLVAQVDTPIFGSAASWEQIGHVIAGQSVVASGPPELVEEYWMVPIIQGGAVQLEALRLDTPE